MLCKPLWGVALLLAAALMPLTAMAAPGQVALKYTNTNANIVDGLGGLKQRLTTGTQQTVIVRVHTPRLQMTVNHRALHISATGPHVSLPDAEVDHVLLVEDLINQSLTQWSTGVLAPQTNAAHWTEYDTPLDMNSVLNYGTEPPGDLRGIDIVLATHTPAGVASNVLATTDISTPGRPRRIVVYLQNILTRDFVPEDRDGTLASTWERLRVSNVIDLSPNDYIDMLLHHTLVHELGHAFGLVHSDALEIGERHIEILDPLISNERGTVNGETTQMVRNHNPSIMTSNATAFLANIASRYGRPVRQDDIRPSGRDNRGVLSLWRMRPESSPPVPNPQPPQDPKPPVPPKPKASGWLSNLEGMWMSF